MRETELANCVRYETTGKGNRENTAMRREGRSYVGDASRQGKKHDVFQRDTVDRVE